MNMLTGYTDCWCDKGMYDQSSEDYMRAAYSVIHVLTLWSSSVLVRTSLRQGTQAVYLHSPADNSESVGTVHAVSASQQRDLG